MINTLRITGITGLLLFGMAFMMTYGVPEVIEESAKGFVKNQVTKEVKTKIAPITNSSLAQKAKQLADKLGYQESQIKQDIENNLPEKIAEVMAKMCGYDCEKKKQLASSIKNTYLEKIQNLKVGQLNLSALVKGKYVEVVGQLKLDIRIFTFSTALMFLMMLLITMFKPSAYKHLYIPGFLLLAATLVSIGFYVFGQDWFYTIIYNDYMGWSYLAYLGVIFLFFVDVALNKGRVTCEIFNFLGNAISSIGSISPC